MNDLIENHERLARFCLEHDSTQGIQVLLDAINQVFPKLNFEHVLSRGGWHRLGGVVDANHQRVTDNIAQWAEQESGGDPEQLVVKYMDSVYFATHLAGKTHYFSASTGDAPQQYIQLEVEELQEVIDRPLVDGDWFPDSMEEFLDPLDYPRLEPEPVGKPKMILRRMTPIDQLVVETSLATRHQKNICRFMQDWSNSSAADCAQFHQHWVLALREYTDTDGDKQITAKPVSTFDQKGKKLQLDDAKAGSELANAIQRYDHAVGYHFSWYFMMLSSQSENFALADAVLRDLMGAYDYLPQKDLKVLRDWEVNPYSV